MIKRIPEDTKKLLMPFFPHLNLEEVVLIDNGIALGRTILNLLRASAITFGDRIYFAKRLDRSNISNTVLIGHELVHVDQYKRLGFLGLGIRYLTEFMVNLVREKDWMRAYMSISFEKEAYQTEKRIFEELISKRAFSTPFMPK